MNLAHLPCNFMLYQFWLPFLILPIRTIHIWWWFGTPAQHLQQNKANAFSVNP